MKLTLQLEFKLIQKKYTNLSDALHAAIVTDNSVAAGVDGEGYLNRVGQAKSVRSPKPRSLLCDLYCNWQRVEVGAVEKKLSILLLKIPSV